MHHPLKFFFSKKCDSRPLEGQKEVIKSFVKQIIPVLDTRRIEQFPAINRFHVLDKITLSRTEKILAVKTPSFRTPEGDAKEITTKCSLFFSEVSCCKL